MRRQLLDGRGTDCQHKNCVGTAALGLTLILAACDKGSAASAFDMFGSEFGGSYDQCLIKNAVHASDTAGTGLAEEVCERHFTKFTSGPEAQSGDGSAQIDYSGTD